MMLLILIYLNLSRLLNAQALCLIPKATKTPTEQNISHISIERITESDNGSSHESCDEINLKKNIIQMNQSMQSVPQQRTMYLTSSYSVFLYSVLMEILSRSS